MPFATTGHFAIRKIFCWCYIMYIHVKNPITTCNEPQNKNDSTDSQEQIFHHLIHGLLSFYCNFVPLFEYTQQPILQKQPLEIYVAIASPYIEMPIHRCSGKEH